ncbi:hypothetical protein I547_6911, partial [Mycobacterium kansasii 824]
MAVRTVGTVLSGAARMARIAIVTAEGGDSAVATSTA